MSTDGIESSSKLTSRRRVLAHMLICKGCCCGVAEKRNSPVPVEWLKQEWRNRRLSPSITLTISEGCLGPCDLANVVCITSPHGVVWLGQIELHLHYARLVDWAEAVARTDALLPLPSAIDSHRFDRFRSPSFGFQKEQAPRESQGFTVASVGRAGSCRTELLH